MTVNEFGGGVRFENFAVLRAHGTGEFVTENHGALVGGVRSVVVVFAAGTEFVSPVHKRLGGHAPDIDAGAAVHVRGLLDQGNVLAGFRVGASKGFAALAEADNDHVEVKARGSHSVLPVKFEVFIIRVWCSGELQRAAHGIYSWFLQENIKFFDAALGAGRLPYLMQPKKSLYVKIKRWKSRFIHIKALFTPGSEGASYRDTTLTRSR